MPPPHFKGHEFEDDSDGCYRCVRCPMEARETLDSYEFSLPEIFAIVSKQSDLDDSSSVPACKRVENNSARRTEFTSAGRSGRLNSAPTRCLTDGNGSYLAPESSSKIALSLKP